MTPTWLALIFLCIFLIIAILMVTGSYITKLSEDERIADKINMIKILSIALLCVVFVSIVVAGLILWLSPVNKRVLMGLLALFISISIGVAIALAVYIVRVILIDYEPGKYNIMGIVIFSVLGLMSVLGIYIVIELGIQIMKTPIITDNQSGQKDHNQLNPDGHYDDDFVVKTLSERYGAEIANSVEEFKNRAQKIKEERDNEFKIIDQETINDDVRRARKQEVQKMINIMGGKLHEDASEYIVALGIRTNDPDVIIHLGKVLTTVAYDSGLERRTNENQFSGIPV